MNGLFDRELLSCTRNNIGLRDCGPSLGLCTIRKPFGHQSHLRLFTEVRPDVQLRFICTLFYFFLST